MGGETEEQVSGWTVDTLRLSLMQRIEDLVIKLDERFDNQKEAIDVALIAQTTAMRTALEAAEKAVTTALLSAEKAVTKAELAADKRFESVNEFRQQLNDQAQTFMPRAEAERALTALGDKLGTESERLNQRIADMDQRVGARIREIVQRLDLSQGNEAGSEHRAANTRMAGNQIAQAVAVVIAALTLVVLAIKAFIP